MHLNLRLDDDAKLFTILLVLMGLVDVGTWLYQGSKSVRFYDVAPVIDPVCATNQRCG